MVAVKRKASKTLSYGLTMLRFAKQAPSKDAASIRSSCSYQRAQRAGHRPDPHRSRRRFASHKSAFSRVAQADLLCRDGHKIAAERLLDRDLLRGDGHEVVGFGDDERLETVSVLDISQAFIRRRQVTE